MTDDDIYTVGEVPPALVPLADLERERLWRANAQADLHELEQKYNALVAACRELVAARDNRTPTPQFEHRLDAAIDGIRPHLPEPTPPEPRVITVARMDPNATVNFIFTRKPTPPTEPT